MIGFRFQRNFNDFENVWKIEGFVQCTNWNIFISKEATLFLWHTQSNFIFYSADEIKKNILWLGCRWFFLHSFFFLFFYSLVGFSFNVCSGSGTQNHKSEVSVLEKKRMVEMVVDAKYNGLFRSIALTNENSLVVVFRGQRRRHRKAMRACFDRVSILKSMCFSVLCKFAPKNIK